MILLFLLLLLHPSSADFLSDHLTHNVDLSVHPCDNFYLHVCSQSIDEEQFPFKKISQFYENISQEHEHVSGSRNFAILNDLAILINTDLENKPKFNRSLFRSLIESRCAEDDECYRKEFTYFYRTYMRFIDDENGSLNYWVKKIENVKKEGILKVLLSIIDLLYRRFGQSFIPYAKIAKEFYSDLTNRLFVMEDLKRRGIFKGIEKMNEDLSTLKTLIIKKFRNTPWMNSKDELGLSLLAEFEDKVNDLVIHYDMDEHDKDLELFRDISSRFMKNYYLAKQKSTGVEALDILFAACEAEGLLSEITEPEELMLVERVKAKYDKNAMYSPEMNSVVILAPFIYPKLTDGTTFDKPYDLFVTIAHEIFHSVINATWAERSDAFKNGMECLNDHFNRTCETFGEKSCNSGPQTFEEDGPDIEGLRVSYDWFLQSYDEEELKEEIFKTDSLSVNREQAFFYLSAFFFCETIDPDRYHKDVHSYHQVRINGDMTQMPEFSRAFSCNPEQGMYSVKEDTCHLFGPDSK